LAPDPHRIAAAIGRLGPGGVRIAQLLALRRDIFEPALADALALARSAEPMPPDAALAIVARELAPGRASLIGPWVAVAEPDPLAWVAQGFAAGREIRIRIALVDRIPSPETIAAAIRLATALLPAADRDTVRVSLQADQVRWIAADGDTAAQHVRLARWRRQALCRTGTIVARPLDDWASAHVIGLAAIPGLPLPEVVALAANGGDATLDAHDIEARAAARRLIEATLEQALLFGSIPVETRLDHLAVLPGNRIARIDAGAVEPLSTALKDALPAIARMTLADDPVPVAARLTALLPPGPRADPVALTDRIEDMMRRTGDGDAAPRRWLDDMLAAARACGHRVPADVLALGRWFARMIEAAIEIDPAIDVGEVARHFLFRRAIEAAVAMPDSTEAARRALALIAPLEALPGRLDRLLADATNRHYRMPIEQHRSAEDRRLRIAQARLLAVAIGWTGIALLLLIVRDQPGGPLRTALETILWTGAAATAGFFALLWRRSA